MVENNIYRSQLLLARYALLAGKVAEAEAAYKALCLDFPDAYSARVDYGRFAYFILKDKKLATHLFNLALKLNDNLPCWVAYLAGRKKSFFIRVAKELVYTPIPKNGSTSIKHFILKHVRKLDIEKKDEHQYFENAFYRPGITPVLSDKRLVVFRDPIERFLSYYKKNINECHSLKTAAEFQSDKKFDLDLRPSLDVFIERISEYCFHFDDVLHHVVPQAAFISNVMTYDFIFQKDRIDEAISKIAECAGVQAWRVPREMVTENNGPVNLDRRQLAFLNSFYADDYKMFTEIPGWKMSPYYHAADCLPSNPLEIRTTSIDKNKPYPVFQLNHGGSPPFIRKEKAAVNIVEYVRRAKQVEPLLEHLHEGRGTMLLREVFRHIAWQIEEAPGGVVEVEGLGLFFKKKIEQEKDGQKAVVKQVLFKLSSEGPSAQVSPPGV